MATSRWLLASRPQGPTPRAAESVTLARQAGDHGRRGDSPGAIRCCTFMRIRFGLLALLVPLLGWGGEPGWQTRTEGRLRVSTRARPHSRVKEVRVETDLAAPALEIQAALMDM